MKSEKISEIRTIAIVERFFGTARTRITDNGAIVDGGIGTTGITLTWGNSARTYLVSDRTDCNEFIRYARSL